MCQVVVWHGFCDCAFGSAQNDEYPDLRVQVSVSGFSGQQCACAGMTSAHVRAIEAGKEPEEHGSGRMRLRALVGWQRRSEACCNWRMAGRPVCTGCAALRTRFCVLRTLFETGSRPAPTAVRGNFPNIAKSQGAVPSLEHHRDTRLDIERVDKPPVILRARSAATAVAESICEVHDVPGSCLAWILRLRLQLRAE